MLIDHILFDYNMFSASIFNRWKHLKPNIKTSLCGITFSQPLTTNVFQLFTFLGLNYVPHAAMYVSVIEVWATIK